MEIEHLSDLPVLFSGIEKTELSELFDSYFTDHKNWQGISGGQLLAGWLLYILSEGDHRLSHVEEWAAHHLRSLQGLLAEPELRALDFNDDRLANLLDRLSDDTNWQSFEQQLGKNLIKVYRLSQSEQEPRIIRNDSVNVPQYRAEEGLFRYGYSKQRRSDQPFCKVMMSTLDPLAMPIAVDIVKGSGPDVDLYLPLIKRVQDILQQTGNLYVGDSQLGSISNRSSLHSSGDYYLMPLSKKQVVPELLRTYLQGITVEPTELSSIFTEADSKRKSAYFYEVKELVREEQSGIEWEERRILVYSPHYAQGLDKVLENRIARAQEEIERLVISKRGRRNPKTLDDLKLRVQKIKDKHKVQGCLVVEYKEEVSERKVKRHKDRPEEIRRTVKLDLKVERDEEYIKQEKQERNWQVYGTNVPQEKMTAARIVETYRDEYRIEHVFDYLLNRDTGLLPVYLQKQERIKGLIRLLSIAIQFSMLIQHEARTHLSKTSDKLKGIYPGNKGRATDKPTTPMLLRAFRGISFVCLDEGGKKVIRLTELNKTQEEILGILKIPDIYKRFLKVLQTQINMRET